MDITNQSISSALCKMEGGKEEINVAQMNEIVSKLPKLFATMTTAEKVEFLKFLTDECETSEEKFSTNEIFNEEGPLVEKIRMTLTF